LGAGAEIPPGAEVIDLGDATLLPGFMDAHTHLTFPYTADYRQQELDNFKKTTAEKAIESTVNARLTLMAGFTTVRDVGSGDYMDVGLRNAIASGKVPGPRMLVAVHSLGSTGGHCDDAAGYKFNLFGRESGIQDGVINTPDEARAAVRFNIKYGADVIKTCATGGVLSLADDVDTPQLTQAELDAMISEAHALRRKVAAHAHGAEGAKRAVRAGIDSIEHGSFLDDEALDLMKSRGTYYVPTLMAIQGVKETLEKGYLPPQIAVKGRAAIAALDTTVKKAITKGVKIAVGTDAAVYPHGRNAGEFVQLVRLGMKPIDALKAGTSVDAQLLGLSERTGMLAAGKLADIVAVPGNPLEDIRVVERVKFVMKEGVVFKNEQP
jgi:imidazolonepropionase-like amidohydrolase